MVRDLKDMLGTLRWENSTHGPLHPNALAQVYEFLDGDARKRVFALAVDEGLAGHLADVVPEFGAAHQKMRKQLKALEADELRRMMEPGE